MNLIVILIVNGALETNPYEFVEGLEDLEIRGKEETIKSTALLRSARILRRELETRKDLLSIRIEWKSIRNSQIIIIIIIMGLWHTNGSPNLGQTIRPYNNQQKKKICKIIDFVVPADHRIKLRECEKRDKYLDLARELKKLWNMKVTIIPIVIGSFGMVTKGLLKGLEDLEVGGRVETIQTTALMKTARLLRRVLETWGDLLSLNLQSKTIIKHRCEKL